MSTQTRINAKILNFVDKSLAEYEERLKFFRENNLESTDNLNAFLAARARKFSKIFLRNKSSFDFVAKNYSRAEHDVVMSYYPVLKSIRKNKLNTADTAEVYLSFLHLMKRISLNSKKIIDLRLSDKYHLRFDTRSPGDIERIKRLDLNIQNMRTRNHSANLKKIKKIEENYSDFKDKMLDFISQEEPEFIDFLKMDINKSFKYIFKSLKRKDKNQILKMMKSVERINQPKIKIIDDEIFFH